MTSPSFIPVNPSFEYLDSCLAYDPRSGRLTWKERPVEPFKTERAWKRWNTVCAGKEAGVAS